MKFLKTFFFIISFISKINAILDGRLSPIYLDNRYTFTNGEWARGKVFFNEGFDLPAGGTVYLSLDGGAVTNSISLNNGTLTIDKNLSLRGRAYIAPPGYLRTKADATAVFVYYECILQRLFNGPGRVTVVGPFFFQALSTSSGFDQLGGCILDLSQSPDNLYIVGGTVWWRRVVTGVNNPTGIYFSDIDSFFGSVTISPPLYFSGKSTIKATLLTLSTLNILNNGNVNIFPGARVKLNKIDIPNSAQLEIKNASLDFISTGTGQINICTPYASQGTISFDGNCIIRSSTNNKLWLHDKVTLEFFSGSRLSLPSATSFSILPLAS